MCCSIASTVSGSLSAAGSQARDRAGYRITPGPRGAESSGISIKPSLWNTQPGREAVNAHQVLVPMVSLKAVGPLLVGPLRHQRPVVDELQEGHSVAARGLDELDLHVVGLPGPEHRREQP